MYLHINRLFITRVTKIHMDLGFMYFIDIGLRSRVKHKLLLDNVDAKVTVKETIKIQLNYTSNKSISRS